MGLAQVETSTSCCWETQEDNDRSQRRGSSTTPRKFGGWLLSRSAACCLVTLQSLSARLAKKKHADFINTARPAR